MPSIEKTLVDAITDVVADNAPGLVADALTKAAETEDQVISATLGILSQVVREEGPSAVEETSKALIGLIKGKDPTAAFALREFPEELDALVNALQSAEAESKKEAVRWAMVAGAVLQEVGALVATALIKRL